MATSTTYLSLIKPEELDTDKIRENFNTNMDTIDGRFSSTYLAVQTKNAVTITGGTITGITDLVVADGGTGVSTLTDGGVLLGSGTGAITAMAVLADSEMIVGNGTTDPIAESGATLRASIGVAIGSNVQAYDAGLLSIAALSTAADKMIYTTAHDTYTTTILSVFARTILDDAAAGNVRTTIDAASRALDNISSCAINAALLLGTSDAYALGSTSKMWSDLFLASGAVINFNNGNVTITHSAGTLTFAAAGDFTSLTLDTALAILEGGTGQTTQTAAFDALSPVTTLGDIIYGNATVDNVRLAGSTSATKQYLTQTGNGSISAAPVWAIIASGDIPDISATYAVVAQTFYIGTTQVAINRSSGALTLAGLTLTTPDIGTPSAGTLTNCDGTASSLTAGAVTNATFTTVLTVNTGTLTLTANVANNSVLTIGAGAVSVSGSNTGDQTNITGNAATVTVDATTSDTTCFVAIFESASGSLEPQTDATLTYNANTGLLSSTSFAGALAGNVTGNVSGSSGSCTGLAASATILATARTINGVSFNGSANITVTADANTLTNTTLKSTVVSSSLTSVGTLVNLTVTNDIAGSITGNAETVTFADNDATNEANEILFAGNAAASGDAVVEADSDFHYNPSTGTVSATIFDGSGQADFASLILDTALSAAEGGTGVANNAANTITFTGNYTLGLTLTANTSVTLPTSGIVVSNTNACTNIEGSYLSVTTGTLNVSGLQTTLTNEAGLYAALSDVSDFVQAAEANSIDSAMYVNASIDHEHLAPDVITGLTEVTSTDLDMMIVADQSDSWALKKVDMGEVRGAGGGDVSKVGTPVDNQIGVWTGDGTIEGDANLTYDGTTMVLGTGQINFPDSQNASADANTLDDYEEGTWTAVIRGSGTAGTYEISSQYSNYTKIGRVIHLESVITLDTSITGGGDGYLQITGCPFTKMANSLPVGAVITHGIDLTGLYSIINFITAGSTSILYISEIKDDAAFTSLPISAISVNDKIMFSITFFE